MTDSTDNHSAAAAVASANPNGKRKKLLAIVLGVSFVAGLAYGTYWAKVGRYVESTDDAYVDGNVVQITPQVAGTVVAINADDTQFVHAGETLVRLDRADAAAALQRNEAQLGQTVRQVRRLFAVAAQLRATVAGLEIELVKAQADLERREKLARTGAISAEELQHARDAAHTAESALTAAREKLAGDRALIDNTTIASQPSVAKAAAQMRAAYLDYQRTVIPAPVSGFVAKRSVQLGQRVGPGTPLMAVVPLDQVWVDANFKEGQLKDIRVGQAVRLTADANDVEYHGTVVGFGAGTGAAFALLPAQNATGNWIKVVQRLPVRIALDPGEVQSHPLHIGLSMEVRIDVHEQHGQQLSQVADVDPNYRTTVFAQQASDVEALIASIIAQNGGTSGTTHPTPAAKPGSREASAARALGTAR